MTLKQFDIAFRSKLGEEHRWPGFKTLIYFMLAKREPVHIVETGCARERDNWSGDGQSTQIWQWVIERTGGSITSFDINEVAVAYAKSVAPYADVQCVDSVIGLRKIQNPERIDLLYLDSFDLTDTIDSPTHHLAELTAIYPRLKSGCLIAVDDCIGETNGKHRFVRDWLCMLGVPPLLESYITIWRKP